MNSMDVTLEEIMNIPSLNDLVQFGRVTQEFQFPGKTQMHKVKMGTLDQGELVDAMAAAEKLGLFTKAKGMKVEILWRAILSIDDVDYSPTEPINHGRLRTLLERSSDTTVDLLFQCYDKLKMTQEEAFVGPRLAEIRKKYETLDFLAIPPDRIQRVLDGEESGGYFGALGFGT